MCLTGVDYFSTLAYQPSIAFLAAGALAPMATLVLIILTLFGALPMYRRVADMSPNGQGSILILEHLLPRWKGKVVVLSLLGFAATSFVITITLSAADAAAHLIENPLAPAWLDHQSLLTMTLLVLLGAVFLRGFHEAIGLAVLIVVAYLSINVVVLVVAAGEIWRHPDVITTWRTSLFAQHGSPGMMVAMAVILFPKLALGLSGFETGVAVMPLVRGDETDTDARPIGRIRNTKKLLAAAALIMSVFLMASSIVSVLLIEPEAFQAGGPADGRALAYLAHKYLGSAFGSVYDLTTVAILWFAGASAMAGLLNLVPLYLPRYGMAPEWARGTRPLVTILTGIGILVTIVFSADVDAQAGAYATGVLVLMSSGAVAVAIAAWRKQSRAVAFASIMVVFLYTTVTNMVERPEGIKIASVFIISIIVLSLVSRALRSTELRVLGVKNDELAHELLEEVRGQGTINIIANRPGPGDRREYEDKLREARETHHLTASDPIIFLEVQPGDASQFSEVLKVTGIRKHGFRVLQCQSPAIPNAIAALLLHIRNRTGHIPHVYFGWTEGNPITYLLKFLAFGEGDTAPVTREVLRLAEPDPFRRPRVHVG
ncbi:MAG: amino acid transporter [Acidobacteria bacterium RIFCSPLOWO2_12_FULL_65_11]|nr:MAG: amino acid transporter [Acidobacteria bacterium RIFCSPLOWO2_12_FULL_65_11]